MKLVLELVSKKGGTAFDKFCDAIKYKYKKLSDQLVKAKESPFKVEKPGMGIKFAYTQLIKLLKEFLCRTCA